MGEDVEVLRIWESGRWAGQGGYPKGSCFLDQQAWLRLLSWKSARRRFKGR